MKHLVALESPTPLLLGREPFASGLYEGPDDRIEIVATPRQEHGAGWLVEITLTLLPPGDFECAMGA